MTGAGHERASNSVRGGKLVQRKIRRHRRHPKRRHGFARCERGFQTIAQLPRARILIAGDA